jgi:hypothetical protein
MRKVIFAIATAGVLAVAGVGIGGNRAEAATVSVTESQVRNVCGKDLQSSGGAIGCRKGATDYNCHGGKCYAITFRQSGQDSTKGTMTGNAPAGNQDRSGSKRTTDPVRAVGTSGTFQRKN